MSRCPYFEEGSSFVNGVWVREQCLHEVHHAGPHELGFNSPVEPAQETTLRMKTWDDGTPEPEYRAQEGGSDVF